MSEVPRLVMRPGLTAPHSAMWLITVEEPVLLRGMDSGDLGEVAAFLVGYDYGWTPPKIFRSRYRTDFPPIDTLLFSQDPFDGVTERVALGVKPGMPSGIELAIPVGAP